jgi:amino acid transporter
MRGVGLVLLGLLIFVCLVPFFSVVVIFPVTILLGAAKWLHYVQLAVVYFLSAVSAIWVVRRLWRPKLQPPRHEGSGVTK